MYVVKVASYHIVGFHAVVLLLKNQTQLVQGVDNTICWILISIRPIAKYILLTVICWIAIKPIDKVIPRKTGARW